MLDGKFSLSLAKTASREHLVMLYYSSIIFSIINFISLNFMILWIIFLNFSLQFYQIFLPICRKFLFVKYSKNSYFSGKFLHIFYEEYNRFSVCLKIRKFSWKYFDKIYELFFFHFSLILIVSFKYILINCKQLTIVQAYQNLFYEIFW